MFLQRPALVRAACPEIVNVGQADRRILLGCRAQHPRYAPISHGTYNSCYHRNQTQHRRWRVYSVQRLKDHVCSHNPHADRVEEIRRQFKPSLNASGERVGKQQHQKRSLIRDVVDAINYEAEAVRRHAPADLHHSNEGV